MKLLIIDDDPGMAALLGRALRKLGHEVVTGFSANEAIHKVGDAVDVVIVDADLEGMNAIELAAVLRGIQPGVGVAFIASTDEVARVAAIGAVLPRVWTVVQVRELLAHFEKAKARGSRPKLAPRRQVMAEPARTPSPVPVLGDIATPMPPVPPATPSIESSDGRLPSRKVRVQCRSWEQVARLCQQHASGKTVLTLRGTYRFAEGEQLVVALALPDELVLALRAECTHVRRDRKGEVFGITLHGLTEGVRERLERMVGGAATQPMPVMAQARAVSELTWD
jgi:CheY-like chemotaxis protein